MHKSKKPVLMSDETTQLPISMYTSTGVGLRDRAFIAVIIHAFAYQRDAAHHREGERDCVRRADLGPG